ERAGAVEEHVLLGDEAGVDEGLGDLGDGVVAHGDDDRVRLEQKVRGRRGESGDAGDPRGDAHLRRAAAEQPEDGDAGVAQRAAEGGGDRAGADEEHIGCAGGHRYRPFARMYAETASDTRGTPLSPRAMRLRTSVEDTPGSSTWSASGAG